MKVVRCQGEGQGSCKRCFDKGKSNRMWLCFLYEIEGLEGCYCSSCVKFFYEQKIFELENRLKECENGYEGTLYLESCKLHDAEERIKQLTDENERLRSQVHRLKEYDEGEQ